MEIVMAPRQRFNPIDFYRKAAPRKPLAVRPPRTRYTQPTTPQLSPTGHFFDKAAPLIADYITSRREKERVAAARAEMKDVLSAYYERGGEKAREAVLNASMDIDETSDDVERDALIAFNKRGGIEAVNAMDPSVSPEAQDMRIALMGDAYRQEREREAAELKRSRELSDTAADRAFRAGESALTRTAADARHKAATRERLEYFGATERAAQKRILDERKYRDEKQAKEDAIVKAEAEQKEQKQLESTAITQDIMTKSIDGAFAALDAARKDPLSFGAAGTLSRIPAILSSSHGGRLRSHIKTLKSPIVMGGIENLRKSSAAGATGFGAMNKEELGILINRLGALDPDTTDDDILWNTLKGIQTQVEVVKKDVLAKVPHDKLRAIGLGHWLPKASMPPSAVKAGVTQAVWDNMTVKEKKVFP
jgi:hypothetical protein